MSATLDELPEVLTVEEAARLLRIGRRQCYERCRSGELPAIRVGGSWRIVRRRLEQQLGLGTRSGP